MRIFALMIIGVLMMLAPAMAEPLASPGLSPPRAAALMPDDHAGHEHEAAAQTPGLTYSKVTIRSGDGTRHVFDMEIADEPEERRIGLMHRTELAEMSGMLFDFGHTDHVSMWMKDTFVPLDILFVLPSGEILSIAERARPESLRNIASGGAVRGVVEIAGGKARSLGIGPGDLVIHDIFGNEDQ